MDNSILQTDPSLEDPKNEEGKIAAADQKTSSVATPLDKISVKEELESRPAPSLVKMKTRAVIEQELEDRRKREERRAQKIMDRKLNELVKKATELTP